MQNLRKCVGNLYREQSKDALYRLKYEIGPIFVLALDDLWKCWHLQIFIHVDDPFHTTPSEWEFIFVQHNITEVWHFNYFSSTKVTYMVYCFFMFLFFCRCLYQYLMKGLRVLKDYDRWPEYEVNLNTSVFEWSLVQ